MSYKIDFDKIDEKKSNLLDAIMEYMLEFLAIILILSAISFGIVGDRCFEMASCLFAGVIILVCEKIDN